jgi:sugar lactone lactonase YvrE
MQTISDVEHILPAQNRLGESPIWHTEEQELYWTDIPEACLHCYNPTSGVHRVFNLGKNVSALAFRQNGGLLMAVEDWFGCWDIDSQSIQFIARPPVGLSGTRFNDGAVDRRGRFWAGTSSKEDNNILYRLDLNGAVHTMETGLTLSNGIGWNPDNTIMYLTDTRRQMIYAYDFDATTGAIENRRPFVHTPDVEDFPDGLTVDSEGFVWSARYLGWRVVRYDPDGNVDSEVRLPVAKVSSCAFGGTQLDELYITTARIGVENQPLAGDLFRLKTNIKGLPEPKFAG